MILCCWFSIKHQLILMLILLQPQQYMLIRGETSFTSIRVHSLQAVTRRSNNCTFSFQVFKFRSTRHYETDVRTIVHGCLQFCYNYQVKIAPYFIYTTFKIAVKKDKLCTCIDFLLTNYTTSFHFH